MNAPISTTTPGMLRAAGLFQETQNLATQGVRSVEETLDVLRASWRGDAYNAYRTSMNNWFEDCSVIIKALGDMINLVQDHAVTTTRGEDSNVQIASAIPTGPGLGI
ncbi:WXG100 family type VII secretion target [Saccharothrix sp. HUAS TT1]|uniref:WXG100 family type VII secretion target n=1 Tax=unclassified Saccharothrix TaxID=2593673 RepID=UPI00345BCE02